MPLPDFLPGRFALARGRPSDYFELEHFHYLPKRPATYADVWVVTYADVDPLPREAPPPVAAGLLCGGAPPGSRTNPPQAAAAALHFADRDAREARWRSAARHDDDVIVPRVVAVAVLSFPTIRLAPRERALGLPDGPSRERAAFVNAHVRTVSRVVVHPQFRGLGLASELVRKLIDVCPTRYVEASAVMAHVHPFFAAAGMRRVEDDPSTPNDATRPAYFIFDKAEGSPCDAPATV
jgi:GNAT superfamily N-acetyltransferase